MVNGPARRRGVFFGWYVCAAAVFIGFAAVGARNGFGAFVVPMGDEFGWTRLEISFVFALGILLNGVIQPFMGQVLDRTGGRKLVLLSTLGIGAGDHIAVLYHELCVLFGGVRDFGVFVPERAVAYQYVGVAFAVVPAAAGDGDRH